MTPIDAAYHVVHDHPGGAKALAPRLGKSFGHLCHEVRPSPDSTAKLGLVDALKISELTGDHRILMAFAESLGYRCVRVEIPRARGALLEAVSRFARETGEALVAMHEAIEDGRITENEVQKFERQVADIAPAALALAERMREAERHPRIARAA
ncbi:MAG: hypothetical protein IPP91_11175 [Betaproteobacteria bacterium]|nr:hypothetical protein [Betaproteobacteria bacterium]